MSKQKDGGPAFPKVGEHFVEAPGGYIPPAPGLSVRDWFAGQVAPAMWRSLPENITNDTACEMTALSADKLADALLTERERKTDE